VPYARHFELEQRVKALEAENAKLKAEAKKPPAGDGK
jgi:uncharacterized small protein (DUF1192 family)